jgi:cytoskeletal protein RodZ
MSIGLALREAREHADLSIEEAAWRTRIRPEYLRALENEDFAALGESAFVRGHVLSYARFLGLEEETAVTLYERDHAETASPLQQLDRRVRVARRPPRPRWLLAAAVATTALIAVWAVGLVHGPGEKPAAVNTLPSLPPNANQASAPAPSVRAEHTAAPAAGPIALGITVSSRCWVEVVADGSAVFSGVIPAGGAKAFTARASLTITLGNAGVAALTFDGAPFTLHAKGVWRATFGPNGQIA